MNIQEVSIRTFNTAWGSSISVQVYIDGVLFEARSSLNNVADAESVARQFCAAGGLEVVNIVDIPNGGHVEMWAKTHIMEEIE